MFNRFIRLTDSLFFLIFSSIRFHLAMLSCLSKSFLWLLRLLEPVKPFFGKNVALKVAHIVSVLSDWQLNQFASAVGAIRKTVDVK